MAKIEEVKKQLKKFFKPKQLAEILDDDALQDREIRLQLNLAPMSVDEAKKMLEKPNVFSAKASVAERTGGDKYEALKQKILSLVQKQDGLAIGHIRANLQSFESLKETTRGSLLQQLKDKDQLHRDKFGLYRIGPKPKPKKRTGTDDEEG